MPRGCRGVAAGRPAAKKQFSKQFSGLTNDLLNRCYWKKLHFQYEMQNLINRFICVEKFFFAFPRSSPRLPILAVAPGQPLQPQLLWVQQQQQLSYPLCVDRSVWVHAVLVQAVRSGPGGHGYDKTQLIAQPYFNSFWCFWGSTPAICLAI